jgi:hypothetical protein
LAVIAVFIFKLKVMTLREATQVKKNTLINVTNGYSDPIDMSSKGISFAFSMMDFFGIKVID